ncbi:hypothetical protein BDM02DRAFT_3111273 [Thelephora ganbajun]|uniref:Uncharacterized protein n=1 Tax=Thelephora ganbajun TaxID=370292 RepID=A0ACB6ZMZ0_THEGA|nr:hypothetical protein BDM02DRAFT_3111273 [Thelephora ganbajun]
MPYLTSGLIFVLSLVSITFIWTEYSYLQSKSALIVITPILLAAALLVFSSFLLPALGKRWRFGWIFKQTVLWEAVWTFSVAPFVIVACLMVAFVLPTEIPVDRPFVTMKVVYVLNAALLSSYSLLFFILAAAMYITGLDAQIWYRDIYGEPTPISLTALLRYYHDKRHPRQEELSTPALGISMRSRNTSSLLCIGPPGACDCEERKPEPLADIEEEKSEDIENMSMRADEELGVLRGALQGPTVARGYSGRFLPRTPESITAAVSVPTLAEMRSQVVITLDRSSVRSL